MSTRSASPTTASRFSANRLRGWISPTSSRQPEARGGGRALQQTSRTPVRARRRFRTIPFKLDDAAPLVVARSKKPPRKSPDAKPHYHDHRERLRKRFDDAGPAALADYELLALFLFRAIPRQDTKPLAKTLLQRFGALDAVLAAPVQRICEAKGAAGAVALELKIVQAMLERASKAEFKQRPVISSWSALVIIAA